MSATSAPDNNKGTYTEKPCEKQGLAKTVQSYLKLLVAPTRKQNLPHKPKLNTHKKIKTQVCGHAEESCLQTHFSTRPGDHFTGLKES